MILLFTNKEDCHPTPVLEKLRAQGVSVFRFNTECLLRDYYFSWLAGTNGIEFTITCKDNGLTLCARDVTVIWERRPEVPLPLIENSVEIDKHNKTEALEFLVWLRYWLKDIPSLGSIVMDRPASSKMLQYNIARDVGFIIPETAFTNTKRAADSFSQGKSTLSLKELGNTGMLTEDGNMQYVFYTKQIPASFIQDAPEEAFSQTVSFIQEYIPKAYELRVTVVGDKVFPAKANSQAQTDETGKIDWRQGSEHGLKWETCDDFPEELSERCRVFLRKMGLNFGCFDFIVTPAGDYIFLECNPNGQWLWIEMETDLNISGAIADWLIAHH